MLFILIPNTFQYQAFHACSSLIMQSYHSRTKSRTNREKFSYMSSSKSIYCRDTFCLDDLVCVHVESGTHGWKMAFRFDGLILKLVCERFPRLDFDKQSNCSSRSIFEMLISSNHLSLCIIYFFLSVFSSRGFIISHMEWDYGGKRKTRFTYIIYERETLSAGNFEMKRVERHIHKFMMPKMFPSSIMRCCYFARDNKHDDNFAIIIHTICLC